MLSQGIQGSFKKYNKVAEGEKLRSENDYVRIQEYEHFYLYAKLDRNHNLLYKETFSKFDIDGIKPTAVEHYHHYDGKMHRGEI